MSKNKKRKKYPTKSIIFILVTVIIIWYSAAFLINQVQSFLVETEKVEVSILENTDSGYGLVSGIETVIPAMADGTPNPIIKEGFHVRKGNAVYEINKKYSYTNDAGLVSYQLDGLEGVTDLKKICDTNLEERYHSLKGKTEKPPKEVKTGMPYAKVIQTFDNITLYATMPKTGYTKTLKPGDGVVIRFQGISYEVKGTVLEILDIAEENSYYMKVKLGMVKEKLFQERIYKIEMPYDRKKAISVPVEALVEKDGKTGIYKLKRGTARWTEVETGGKWKDQNRVLIKSGLEEGNIIVTTPKMVDEGEHVKF